MNTTKTDSQLGYNVHQWLRAKGVETPLRPIIGRNGCVATSEDPYPMDNDARKAAIESHFAAIMNILGLDLKDDSLIETPKRVAKMYVDEIFYGLDYAKFPKATTVENKMEYDEMVMERNISVQSNCEHHFVVISGKACVAYIPNKKVLGLSKINRIVEFFAKRPQIQERLTVQIYHALQHILDTSDIAVIIEAEHYCVKSRGVRDEGSSTTTSKLGGKFMDPALRSEFMSLAAKA
jgi:GTP cyclohydrolase IA